MAPIISTDPHPQPNNDEYWDSLSGEQWVGSICYNKHFATLCRWHKLDVNDWVNLLSKCPEYADRCPWGDFGNYKHYYSLTGLKWLSLQTYEYLRLYKRTY